MKNEKNGTEYQPYWIEPYLEIKHVREENKEEKLHKCKQNKEEYH